MRFNSSRLVWALLFILLFISGIVGGYIYFMGRQDVPAQFKILRDLEDIQEWDLSSVRVYYPIGDRLVMEERKVKRQQSLPAMAAAIIEEFLRGSSIQNSLVPDGTRLLNTYMGKDGILYVDISDDIRRNFQGDALGELLLLKGLYESIVSNLAGIEDIKVLIEGKEIETIGGHMSILYPLKDQVTVNLER